MEWSQKLVLVLLDEYQKREILWKPRHPLFYNSIKKEDGWREIADLLNLDIQEIKKKIESLKGSFRREKSRIKKGTGSGKGRDETYVSKWFAYASMKFLEDRDEPKETLSNTVIQLDNEKIIDNTSNCVLSDESGEEGDHSQHLHVNMMRSSHLSSAGESQKKTIPKKLLRSSKKRLLYKKNSDKDPRFAQAFNYRKNKVAAGNQSKDECQVFGEYVASKLRKLNNQLRATGQYKIGNILYELEMAQYNIPGFQSHNYFSQQLPPYHTQTTSSNNNIETGSQIQTVLCSPEIRNEQDTNNYQTATSSSRCSTPVSTASSTQQPHLKTEV